MSRPCKGNMTKLVALMEGSLRPRAAERVRRHLQSCPGCSRAFEQISRAKSVCQELGQVDSPELPWRQIEAQIHWRLATERREQKQQREPRRSLSPAFAALAGAAVVGAIVAVSVVGWLGIKDRQQPTPTRVSTTKPAAPVQDEELAAVATLVQGEVQVLSTRGDLVPLEFDRPLLQGTRIITATGRTAVQWGQGSGVFVVDDTEVDLTRLRHRQQELSLHKGRVLLQLAKLKPAQSFAVVAGGIRTSVRGTFFSVARDDRGVEVEVYEGGVHVEPTDGGWSGLDVPAEHRVMVPVGSKHRPRLERITTAPDPSLMNLVPWPSFQRVMGATGLITVTSLPPGADIKLDSLLVGTTNIRLRSPLGRHLVELWREGVLLEKHWIEIQPQPTRIALDIRRHLYKPRPPKLPARLRRFIQQRAIQIQACYERRLKHNPSLHGRLTLRINVDEDGKVSQVSQLVDTLDDPKVGQCAQHVIERWHFPPGRAAQVVYPFIFRAR